MEFIAPGSSVQKEARSSDNVSSKMKNTVRDIQGTPAELAADKKRAASKRLEEESENNRKKKRRKKKNTFKNENAQRPPLRRRTNPASFVSYLRPKRHVTSA